MSHRWDCPTRWEAERQGERAFERGSGRWRNPYERRPFEDAHCREAERAWEDGHRQAERRAEEVAIEQRNAQRREQEREWARQDEADAYVRQQEREYEEYCNAEYARLEAEHYFWLEQEQLQDAGYSG